MNERSEETRPRQGAEAGERTGISNRESAEQESAERAAYPPVDTSSPPPADASGNVGDEPTRDFDGRQTAHKAGSRSIAQKEADTRYPDRSAPPSRKVAGAFGKEPSDVDVDRDVPEQEGS